MRLAFPTRSRPPAALALLALLASGCGMLDARLETRTTCYTLPELSIPGATTPGQISTDLALDVGSALPILSEQGVHYGLRLRDVTLAVSSSSPDADLGGLDAFALSPAPTSGSGLLAPELVRYERAAGAPPHPTSITAPATGDVDLAPYVADGWLQLSATANGTLPSAPWRATVTACFLLDVDVQYGERL